MKPLKLVVLLFVFQIISCSNQFAELPKEVGIYFEQNLKDPSSFELVEISSSQINYLEFDLHIGGKPKEISINDYVKKESEFDLIRNKILEDEENFPIIYRIRYRAKNSFGALNLSSKFCVTLPSGTLIGCYDNFDDYSDGIYEKILKPKIMHLLY